MTGIISNTQVQSNARFEFDRDHGLKSFFDIAQAETEFLRDFRARNRSANVRQGSEEISSDDRFIFDVGSDALEI